MKSSLTFLAGSVEVSSATAFATVSFSAAWAVEATGATGAEGKGFNCVIAWGSNKYIQFNYKYQYKVYHLHVVLLE